MFYFLLKLHFILRECASHGTYMEVELRLLALTTVALTVVKATMQDLSVVLFL